MKHAIVIPIIKKGSQDSTQLKSYRPVSNLPLLAKLLEKVVQGQLHRYLTANNAMPQHQSAYRQYHSTETALIKITNYHLCCQQSRYASTGGFFPHTRHARTSSLTAKHSCLLSSATFYNVSASSRPRSGVATVHARPNCCFRHDRSVYFCHAYNDDSVSKAYA